MSLRDRRARRRSHDFGLRELILPAAQRPKTPREMFEPREQEIFQKAIRKETRYERRKRK